jgi:hypothetical protein
MQSTMSMAPGAYTTWMPTDAAPMHVAPMAVAPQAGMAVENATSYIMSPAGSPEAMTWQSGGDFYSAAPQAMTYGPQMMSPAGQPVMGQPVMAQPMIATQTGAAIPPASQQPLMAPSYSNVEPGAVVPGQPQPAGPTVPTYGPQPVQLGVPVPISQSPQAGVPAVTQSLPMVTPF